MKKAACVMMTASVTTPKGFKEAYQQLVEGGWTTLSGPEEFGGQGLPRIVGNCVMEFMISANQALEMYTGLTHGARLLQSSSRAAKSRSRLMFRT